jgi:heme/copper-type cytochrome/quinol oxidase subunit 2
MEAQPDVQLGKIFIVLWVGLMIFIIILVIVVYFNAKSEASDCDPKELNTEKSEKKSESPTPKMFIAFLVITAFAVSTMNLTYKVNYFKKKTEETLSGPASPVLAMLKKYQAQQGQQGAQEGINYSIHNNIESSNSGNEQSSQ